MGLTLKRDLRTGAAVWSSYRVPSVKGHRLTRSTRADIVIVGAGITGAMVAQRLVAAGMRPLIIDRRRAALLGSTAASTALLQFELDTPLSELSSVLGRRRAERVWLASREAVNDLRTRSTRMGLQCQFESLPSLYLAGDRLDPKGLRREARARQRIGLPSEYLDRRSLRRHFTIHRAAALLSHGNAQANPVQLAAGYLRAAIRGGARMHGPHEVVGLHSGRYEVTLSTADGLELRARRVVLCTGYEVAKIVSAPGDSVHSTWVLATRPQSRRVWPQRALIWEAAEPYLYLRTTADGRVICGGEDAPFSSPLRRDELTSRKIQRLSSKLGLLFPHLDARPEFSWAGSFGSSTTGLPTIGAVPGYPKCYAAMGFGGNGITFSMLAARLLVGAIMGRTHPDAPLFAFR